MPRAMSDAFLAAIQSQELRPAIFVEANFTSGPIYVWTGVGSITWGGHTWSGLGALASISTIEEGATVEARGITLGLSGIDVTLLTGIMDEFQVGLPVLVYFGIFDATGALIADPVASWAGRTDQPTLDVSGETMDISINCENRLVEMNVAVDKRYTNEQQNLDYPGDRGMEFVAGIQEVQIYWGRSPSNTN